MEDYPYKLYWSGDQGFTRTDSRPTLCSHLAGGIRVVAMELVEALGTFALVVTPLVIETYSMEDGKLMQRIYFLTPDPK